MKIGIIAPGIWGTVFLDNARSLVKLGGQQGYIILLTPAVY